MLASPFVGSTAISGGRRAHHHPPKVLPITRYDVPVSRVNTHRATITSSLADAQVALALPRFGIETKAELATILVALGMPTAFGDAADFSGITSAERLAISNVIHQANIDVDEKGTEAAAATAVVMRESAMPSDQVSVRLDRPFLFALRDLPTGAILFLGRVGDPSIGR